MHLICITKEQPVQNEAAKIQFLLENGVDILHLRKPTFSEEEVSSLLSEIESRFYPRIVLHDHFHLTSHFPVRGIHLNQRNNRIPLSYKGKISRSCHSITEIAGNNETYEYLFLSPIFDSISKSGYRSRFSEKELADASRREIINPKIIALGGITPEHILKLKPYSFGGVAVLGYLWNNADTNNEIKTKIDLLRSALDQIEQPCYNS